MSTSPLIPTPFAQIRTEKNNMGMRNWLIPCAPHLTNCDHDVFKPQLRPWLTEPRLPLHLNNFLACVSLRPMKHAPNEPPPGSLQTSMFSEPVTHAPVRVSTAELRWLATCHRKNCHFARKYICHGKQKVQLSWKNENRVESRAESEAGFTPRHDLFAQGPFSFVQRRFTHGP